MNDELPSVETIPAGEWNAARADWQRHRPRPGPGVRLAWTRDGVILSAEPRGQWRHPWWITPSWREDPAIEPQRGEWVASIRPGFVNGRDVTIPVAQDDGSTIHVPLTAEPPPEITLGSFRDPTAPGGFGANTDGDLVTAPGEGYPRYFESLGVKPPWLGGKLGADAPEFDPDRTRQIRACDVVLITPRLGSRQIITVHDPFTTAQSVEIATEYLNGRVRSAPSRNYLVTLPKFTPLPERSALDLLSGTAVETEQDEMRIATVWFVSQPDVADDAPVDASWTPYAQYAAAWNLNHATRADPGRQPGAPISFHTGLAFGVADSLINFLLSGPNDLLNQVEAFLGAADYSGHYWST